MPPFKNVEERKYPYFGKTEFGIVLFSGPNTGICVKEGSTKHPFKFGQLSKNWGEENFQKMDISEIHLIETISTTTTHKTILTEN